jgi:cytochrome b6-f complex iron-sulfur subunit
MDRRSFVRGLPIVSSGVLGASQLVALSACGGVRYVVPRATPDRLHIGIDELASGGVFVQSPEMARPVYVRRLQDGEISAVLASCTHQGCQPSPVADRLICPCHGSEFSFEGRVLQGPADRPLTRYEVSLGEDELTVWLDRAAR